jgi:hypothetical protein
MLKFFILLSYVFGQDTSVRWIHWILPGVIFGIIIVPELRRLNLPQSKYNSYVLLLCLWQVQFLSVFLFIRALKLVSKQKLIDLNNALNSTIDNAHALRQFQSGLLNKICHHRQHHLLHIIFDMCKIEKHLTLYIYVLPYFVLKK